MQRGMGSAREFLPREKTEIELLSVFLTKGLMGIKRLKEHILQVSDEEFLKRMLGDIDKLLSQREIQKGYKRIFEIVEDFILGPKPQFILKIHLLNEMTRETSQETYIAYQLKQNFYTPPLDHCTRTSDKYVFTMSSIATGTNIPQVSTRIPINRAERRAAK